MVTKKRDIFEKRENIKPYEYPELLGFVDAIDDSFWTVRKYSFNKDVKEYNYSLDKAEKGFSKRGMLAISQVENTVKSFFARLDMRLPKPEISFAGVKFAANECFDDETEVLTEDGFYKFKDLPKNLKVAQYNMETKEISYELPLEYIEKEYQGLMHHYDSSATDIKVTPNHDIIVINPHSKKVRKAKSFEGKWGRNFLYPSSGLINKSESTNITPEERLLVALQADGSLFGTTPSGVGRRDFSFNLGKERKVERLEKILKDCGIEYYKRYKESCIKTKMTVISAKLPDWVDPFNVKNFNWVNVHRTNETWVDEFVEELMFWDGTEGCYYNTNEQAIDKVQIMCTLNGYTVNKGVNRTAEETLKWKRPDGVPFKTAKTCFVLSIRKTDTITYPHRKEVYYDGKVYCVTMPLGTVVIRRGKRVSIQGNCTHSLAYSQCLEELGLNQEFEDLLEVPAMKDRVAYLKKYLGGLNSRSNKEFTKSLVLFTLLIENISLYAPFYVMTAIKKNRQMLKSVGKVIQSTMTEERLHSLFGATLINIIKEENPEWFDDEMEQKIRRNIRKAVKAEEKVIEWMFEEGETDYLKKEYVIEYLKYRANDSLSLIGYEPEYKLNEELLEHSKYLNTMQKSQAEIDFFDNRNSDYNKNIDFESDDLFDDL